MREEKETSLSGKLYVEKDREGNKKQVATTDDIEALEASDLAFDNQTSGLTATNVQAAIDELKALIDNL